MQNLKFSEVIYLIVIVITSIASALYIRVRCDFVMLEGNKLLPEFVLLIGFYPVVFMIFHACLRLYILTPNIFDPYTGISSCDSLVFRRCNSIISIICLAIAMLILLSNYLRLNF